MVDDKIIRAYLLGYQDGNKRKSAIAQSIRNAAINWPQYLGDVECEILDAFSEKTHLYGCGLVAKKAHWRKSIWENQTRHRTFMLFVAEALE